MPYLTLISSKQKIMIKITPETYEKMNEEFEEEGMPFSINVPTQETIDEWLQQTKLFAANQ